MIKEKKHITIIKGKRPKSSIVFDTYWKFASSRQDIFFNKINSNELKYSSDDEILKNYKFTNVYRASDRVSQYLISNVIYSREYDKKNTLFRILLFKIFNKIDTWKILEMELGEINFDSFQFENYDFILSSLLNEKKPIYSAAYIMASAKSSFGQQRKHQNHLLLINQMIEDNLHLKLGATKSMEEGYNLLIGYPSIGTFLAYQLITDINYSNITNYSEMEFVKAGPGAIEGIDKCFSDLGNYTHEDIIKYTTDNQSYFFSKLELDFKTLHGRELQLIDCQNIFCEVAKYARVAHPEFVGSNGRTRIKQKYTPSNEKINYFYPPKWNLNNSI